MIFFLDRTRWDFLFIVLSKPHYSVLMRLQYLMNNDFFLEVSDSPSSDKFISHCLVTGGNNPGVGGYVDEFHNPTGGAKQQLLTLVRSVRTVMRGNETSLLSLIFLFVF